MTKRGVAKSRGGQDDSNIREFCKEIKRVYTAVDRRTDTMWGILDDSSFIRGKRTRNDDKEEEKDSHQ